MHTAVTICQCFCISDTLIFCSLVLTFRFTLVHKNIFIINVTGAIRCPSLDSRKDMPYATRILQLHKGLCIIMDPKKSLHRAISEQVAMENEDKFFKTDFPLLQAIYSLL